MTAATDALLTVRDWLRYAVSCFGEAQLAYGHGTTNAYDEAAYLILWSLHLPLDRLEPFLDARLTAAEKERIAALLNRRVDERVPAAYLTHEAWLGEWSFYVDARVIVPRSFIAELVPDGLEPLVGLTQIDRVLDLCTGSGCLAVLLANAYPSAHVDAVDISAEALDVARINVERHGLAERISIVESNLYAKLEGRTYDLIVSNPPYVTDASMTALPAEYRHEPVLALAGGHDGMDIVRAIVAGAARHLAPGGHLVVEVGSGRDAVEHVLPELPLIWLDTRSSEDAVFVVSREDLVPAARAAQRERARG